MGRTAAPRRHFCLPAIWVQRITEYTRCIGQMFLISMVARIFEPGCKADHMLVLEGPQGDLKSTACAVLGGEWFSDNLPDISDGKDAIAASARQVADRGRRDARHEPGRGHAAQIFITRTTERYRPIYGRHEVIEPRQCVFIGTTNKDTYLRDETGGRRFWPVKCADHRYRGASARPRPALRRGSRAYLGGSPWWPHKEFERLSGSRQSRRLDMRPMSGKELFRLSSETKSRVTVCQVAHEALAMRAERIGTADQRRIAASLERLGWKAGRRKTSGRWWERA